MCVCVRVCYSYSTHGDQSFADDISEIIFLSKIVILWYNSNITKISSQGSNLQQGSIGPDRGLAPIRRQVISKTNIGFFAISFTIISIRVKFHFPPILIWIKSMLQIFTHDTTVVLWRHIQTFAAISLPRMEIKWNEITIGFVLRWKPLEI